jgi:hypothetical protein
MADLICKGSFRQKFSTVLPWLLAALLAGAALPASAQNSGLDIGNVGAANPRSVGTRPGSNVTRDLMIGETIVNKEYIQTTNAGSVQITFVDKTTMNIGRNSSVTIDKFVYDPQSGTGELAVSLGKGVLRFVGGQVSHTSGATVTTPVATIGVRGGTMTVAALDGGGIMVVDHYGAINIANSVSQQTILRPGYAVQVKGRGDAIAEPGLVPREILAKANASLTSRAGQRGGIPPGDSREALAARYGMGSGNLPFDSRTTPGLDTVALVHAGDVSVANRSQQQVANGVVSRSVPATTTSQRSVSSPPASGGDGTTSSKSTTTSQTGGGRGSSWNWWSSDGGGIQNSGTISAGTTINPTVTTTIISPTY